jgi:hypothetical protein
MTYTVTNFPTKKALAAALASGATVPCYNPGPFPLTPGLVTLEGPHFPQPHRWYATAHVDESLNIIPGSLS